ncbi:MAG: 1-acyl-sn-glycerol-3-phosphate acyltransferase [Phycisphaeraceae bacterium]|nr:1-acyl-sn-glycerol-3-phosphate acyltransferase [Phycisphaeraceae bacterium]
MLDFSDQPYQWFPPRRNALVAHIARCYNRWRQLPAAKRIAEVRVTRAADLPRRSRMMLVFNHSTHADASIALEATRQVGVFPIFMAAYDVFLRSRLDAWIMQRLGAFSVDREGADSRAMKQAAETLLHSRHPLTIFPEGNVYLQNDHVTPFHDGAAFMALRAQKELLERDEPLFAVPAAIKATYLHDIRTDLVRRIEELAATVESTDHGSDKTPTPREALRRIGIVALRRNLKLRGIDPREREIDSLRELIDYAAGTVLSGLEKKLGLARDQGTEAPRDQGPEQASEAKPSAPRCLDASVPSSTSLIERLRQCRRKIHEVRTDPQRVADHAAAGTWNDEAMLAFRIISYYNTDYIAEKPTLDRIAETVEKLTEDVHRRETAPFADRRALVHFGEPIDLRAYLAGDLKLRAAVRKLTADLENGVQVGLDLLSAANDAPGAKLWASW